MSSCKLQCIHCCDHYADHILILWSSILHNLVLGVCYNAYNSNTIEFVIMSCNIVWSIKKCQIGIKIGIDP